jgi:hypothetical protein
VIILAGTYYTKYVPLNVAKTDTNKDGKIDIMDNWN